MCSGRTNQELVQNLRRNQIITSARVASVMMATDRAFYCPNRPYEDSPQGIGYGATISAPHMHAHAAEHLESVLQPGSRVLDVGCGSGYLTALMARMVAPGGRVTGIEHIKELVDLCRHNLERDLEMASLLQSGALQIEQGDGRKGYKLNAPYNAIHVGAAAVELHRELVDQLAPGGKMFIPVEEAPHGDQYVYMICKGRDGRSVQQQKLFGVRYVGLTDAQVT